MGTSWSNGMNFIPPPTMSQLPLQWMQMYMGNNKMYTTIVHYQMDSTVAHRISIPIVFFIIITPAKAAITNISPTMPPMKGFIQI